jgi:hypothetical protein
MTEREWSRSPDLAAMVYHLLDGEGKTRRLKIARRKLRLFACACARHFWRWLPEDVCREAVVLGERWADRPGDEEERKRLVKAADTASREYIDPEGVLHPGGIAQVRESLCRRAASLSTWAVEKAKVGAYGMAVAHYAAAAVELAAQLETPGSKGAAVQGRSVLAGFLRDLFGNPFHKAPRNPPEWPPAVLKLAQAAYDERILPAGTLDPARLAVLADALEESGCTDARLLGHLRDLGNHVRGCWAVDLLLHKS